mmetsp:Transcript_18271/g.41705  ORF Transcript_18271/g.41705 Transcript_18271/m.41705 type:complete len:83 (-) Transcript_18271:1763-2011(-)
MCRAPTVASDDGSNNKGEPCELSLQDFDAAHDIIRPSPSLTGDDVEQLLILADGGIESVQEEGADGLILEATDDGQSVKLLA